MSRVIAALILASFIASAVLAQSFDPSIGSGNLTTGLPSTYIPPLSPVLCETRRVQFDNEWGWGVRDVVVCCSQGQCRSYLPYAHLYGHSQ